MMDGPYPGVKYVPCRSCGAQVFWAVTRNGKSNPIDAAARTEGNVVTFFRKTDGTVRVESYDPGKHRGAIRRTSHFATCPDSAQHRRRA